MKIKNGLEFLGITILVLMVLSGSLGAASTRSEQQSNNISQARTTLPCGETTGCPTGLASYGYNATNGATYSIESNESIGKLSFNALQANNSISSFSWAINDPALNNVSTLQLNNVLVANNTDGSQRIYWPQNVLTFGNDSFNRRIVVFSDNVLNATSANSIDTPPHITSPNGTLTGNSKTGFYYGNYLNAPYFFVNTPFIIEQIMEVSPNPLLGVITIYMGTDIIQNGSATPNRLYWFDTVTITDPQVSSAYFFVSDSHTPLGLVYDSEYVFGGPGNGAATTFSAMNSTIGLFYVNSTGSTVPFPSYYSFGSDTAESASNLQVNYLGNGLADVTLGVPNYVYLTTSSSSASSTNTTLSSSLSASSSSSTLKSSSSSSSNTSTLSSSSQSSSTSSTSVSSSASSSSSTSLSSSVVSSSSSTASSSITSSSSSFSTLSSSVTTSSFSSSSNIVSSSSSVQTVSSSSSTTSSLSTSETTSSYVASTSTNFTVTSITVSNSSIKSTNSTESLTNLVSNQSSSTSTPNNQLLSTTTTTTSGNTKAGGNGIPEFPYQIALLLGLIIILISSYVLIRRSSLKG